VATVLHLSAHAFSLISSFCRRSKVFADPRLSPLFQQLLLPSSAFFCVFLCSSSSFLPSFLPVMKLLVQLSKPLNERQTLVVEAQLNYPLSSIKQQIFQQTCIPIDAQCFYSNDKVC
jgi:hypothetical protein